MNATNIENVELTFFTQDGLVVTVYLSILCIVGIIGNGHALLIYTVYYKPTNCRVFVKWLSSIDLSVCAICIPFEVFVIHQYPMFSVDIICKVFRFFTHALVITSGVMLAVIAIHRKQKLGNPRGKQFSLKNAHIACFFVLMVTGIVSIPAVFFYQTETVRTKIPEVDVRQCTLDNDVIQLPYFNIFIGFLTFLTNIVYIICIIAYSFILKVIIGQLKRTSYVISGKTDTPFDSLNHSKQITMLFIATTTLSYVGYMSYIISIWITIIYLDTNTCAVCTISFRGFFLSSAANPVVYLFLDRKFRQECKQLYLKLFGVCRFRFKSHDINS